MNQKDINRSEWLNPDNWSQGPKYLSMYFSHKDSRTWVPKRIYWMGDTVNTAKFSGVAWLIGFILGIPLTMGIVIALLYNNK